ncbi:glycerol-3-phosphate responsive antiterminator [Salicibibacter cibi]|uniref:Glycerol uptake operon antiterminator regulatory protein n=2 Tax=Salicibibacter cibi TaxID=2743001 RepID=A0A7T6ZEG9_9BACI|nr:glycerol-3-phosphate responsive antiterminator [Salicibibacter cibi]
MDDIIDSQVIAAISSENQIQEAIDSSCNVAFLLLGNILSLPHYVTKLKESNVRVFVHMDLVEGLSNDRSAIKFIVEKVKPTGIITTKSYIIKIAKKYNLLTVQRLFIIDRNAITKGLQMVSDSKPDAIELMPGVLPKAIDQFATASHLPIIVGGLIDTKQEIHVALETGALAVSMTSNDLWNAGL